MSDQELLAVEDDTGSITDLVNSLFEPAPAEDSESSADAATEGGSTESGEGLANQTDDSSEEGGSPDTPAEGEGSEQGSDDIEALRKDADLGRKMRNTLLQQITAARQQEEQQQRTKREQAYVDRLAALADEVDPEVAKTKAASYLAELRTEFANQYLPQINAAELESDRNAQGVVVMHATIQELLTPEQMKIFEQKVNRRLEYGDLDSLNRAIADERAAEERISKETSGLRKQVETLTLQLEAMKRASSGADWVPGSEGGSARVQRTLAEINDDPNATVDDLINAL